MKVKETILTEYHTDGVLPDDGLIIANVPAGVIITDESKIPDRFFKIERKLVKSALNKAVKAGDRDWEKHH